MNATHSLTLQDMEGAAEQLAGSRTGRTAMKTILSWLDDDGLSLDQQNQEAVLTLLQGAWGPYAGSARDAMRDALTSS